MEWIGMTVTSFDELEEEEGSGEIGFAVGTTNREWGQTKQKGGKSGTGID